MPKLNKISPKIILAVIRTAGVKRLLSIEYLIKINDAIIKKIPPKIIITFWAKNLSKEAKSNGT